MHLAEEGVRVLGLGPGVGAVTHRHAQIALGVEAELPGVVPDVGGIGRLLQLDQDPLRVGEAMLGSEVETWNSESWRRPPWSV